MELISVAHPNSCKLRYGDNSRLFVTERFLNLRRWLTRLQCSARLNAMERPGKPVQSDAFSNDGKQTSSPWSNAWREVSTRLIRGHEKFVGEGELLVQTRCFRKTTVRTGPGSIA